MQQQVIIEEKDPRTGRVVNQYVRGKLLGRGGFAKCYEATHVGTNESFAIKVVEKHTVSKPKTRQKLKSEIRIHKSISHRNIVSFKRYFEDDARVYMVLELCKGQTLMEHSKRKGRFTEHETSYILWQCLQALKYMHSIGVIHRDLKLGNIMMTETMEVKIGDFGLAARLDTEGEKRKTLCGTPNYIAPEILQSGHGHSFEVDIWTIGVIMYAMLVGKPPFETTDVKTTYGRIKRCTYSFPSTILLSCEAKDLISRILQITPEGRPTVDQLLSDKWFKLFPPSPIAPLSLFIPGTAGYAAQQLRLGQVTGDKPKREPLRQLDVNNPSSTRTRASQPIPKAAEGPIYRSSSARNLHHPPQMVADRPKREGLRQIPSEAQRSPRQAAHSPGMAASPRSRAASLPHRRTSPTAFSNAVRKMSPQRETPRLTSQSPHRDPVHLDADPAIAGLADHRAPPADDEDIRNLTEMGERLNRTLANQAEGKATAADTDRGNAEEAVRSWVTDYTDFTAKYGMAYRLSDGNTGVHFNDCTKMILKDDGRVEYYHKIKNQGISKDNMVVYSLESYPAEMNKKITLIKYFKSFIAKTRGKQTKDGQHKVVTCSKLSPRSPATEETVYVKKWLRTKNAMVFRLSNRVVQVCFDDGIEVMLSTEAKRVTFVDPDGVPTYLALSPSGAGHPPLYTEKLRYTREVIQQLIGGA